MTVSQAIVPPKVDGRRPHFSQAVVSGDHLFLSGQLPFGPDMTIEGGDIAVQTRVCLRNIEAILADHSLTLQDISKTTIWLARVEDFPAFNHAYASVFLGPVVPARSTVRADLMVPGALVEIEAVAKLRGGQQ